MNNNNSLHENFGYTSRNRGMDKSKLGNMKIENSTLQETHFPAIQYTSTFCPYNNTRKTNKQPKHLKEIQMKI